MCIFGGHDGFFIFAGVIVPFLLIWRLIGRSRRIEYDSEINEFRGARSDHMPKSSIEAWMCLDPKCRRRNPAGARFCGRCGASRGYTYRVDESSGD